MDIVAWLLRLVGLGLVAVGAAHVLLPRALGWSAGRHATSGPLSALVIKMHIAAVGLFLGGFGALTVLGAGELESGSPILIGLLISGVIIFGLRWVAEIVLVSRALRRDLTIGRGWRMLHGAALISWLLIAVTYALGLGVVLAQPPG